MSKRVIEASSETRKIVTLVLDEQTAADLSGLLFNGVAFDKEPWASELHEAIEAQTDLLPTSFAGAYLERVEE